MTRSTAKIIPLSAVLKTTVDRIEKKYHNQPTDDSVSTGFHSLDDMTDVFRRGDLVAVLSDIPDLTTMFMLSSVHSMIFRDRVSTLFVSCRHDENYVATKLLSIESGIWEGTLRDAMLNAVHRSALTASANMLWDASLHIAAIDTLSLEEFVETLRDADSHSDSDLGPIIIDGVPMYHRSDEPVLQRLREHAVGHGRPVVLSSVVTADQRDEWRFDRWFDVILRVDQDEPFSDLIQVEILKNRHGSVGTAYLSCDRQRSLVHDIDVDRLSWVDLYTSLRTINGRHGETLRRLGEGVQ